MSSFNLFQGEKEKKEKEEREEGEEGEERVIIIFLKKLNRSGCRRFFLLNSP